MKNNVPVSDGVSDNTIRKIISESPMSVFQVLIVIMCFVLNMNDGIDIFVVSYTAPEIMSEWGLTATEQGYIFSLGLAGMTLGCLFIAPLADRIGRRKLFILAITVETAGMILSYFVTSFNQLLFLRLISGLGVGGLLPTMAALATEFSNNKRKDLAVGFVQAGWPIGAIFMGFFTAWVVPEFGWRSAYLSAGIISGLMLIMIIFFMPESAEYLWYHQPKGALKKINNYLHRTGHQKLDSLPERKKVSKPKIIDLFTKEYKESTIRLWIGIFFGFLTMYTLISWMPTIANNYGMSFEKSTYVGTVLNIGAFIGSTGIGWLAARFNLKKLIATFFAISFVIMVAYGSIPLSNALIFMVSFLIGVVVQGGFNGYWPATARVYETKIRTTGIGMAVGAGRFGAILGPLLFGILSDMELSVPTLFIIFSVPLVISAIAVYGIPSKNLK